MATPTLTLMVITHTPMVIMVIGVRVTGVMVDGVIMVPGVTGVMAEEVTLEVRVTGVMVRIADSTFRGQRTILM